MVKTEKIPEGYHATEAGILPVDWQVKRLSEVATELTERAGQDKYETVSISAGIGFVNQAEKFGKELSGKQYEKYIVLHQGDFSYNKGNSKTSPQGCIYRLNDRETAAVPNVFESFRIEDQNADYYEQLFLSGFLNKQLYSKINRGVRDDGLLNLTGKDFYSCAVPVPPIAEQKKIAEVLSCCGRVIELKQQLIAELQRLKSGFLQAMFPTKGHSESDIRFPEFSDTWEQRKVTDLGEIYIGLVTTMTEHYTDNGHLLIRNSDIKDGYFEFGENPIYLDEEFSEQNKSRRHQIGDVITVHTGDIGTSAVIGENEVNSIGFATIVTRPNQEVLNSNYLATYLNTDIHKRWAISMATGDGRSNYNLKDYTKLMVPVPRIEEQKKIAAYISNLNTLITLHQQELEETKKKKKSLAKLLLTGSVRVPT